jgi:hypothetical protein
MATKLKNTLSKSTSPNLIAPCGINCRLCRAYVREKTVCPGCRGDDHCKPLSCIHGQIKTCEKSVNGKFEYCFECDELPCKRLAHLDKRYRTRYGLSVIENLKRIKEVGILQFVEEENQKWTCVVCGSMLCMHQPACLRCGSARVI